MNDFLNKTEYTQADIEQLLKDEIEESIKLDYKEFGSLAKNDRKKKDISKDVSAFANSDGGLIIYGVEEKNHKPVGFSFINGEEISKEWLEQVIQSNIFRRIDGLQIFPIRYSSDVSKSVYVVKIPSSSTVPHMANDNRFYRRYNFNSVPMEEYEIRNLYFKQEKTILKLATPEIHVRKSSFQGIKIIDLKLQMRFHIDNFGATIEKLYKLEVAIPKQVYSYSQALNQSFNNLFIREENDYSLFLFPNQSPLFQKERATFTVPNLTINRASFPVAVTKPIKLKMYSTGGIEEMNIDLEPYFILQEKPITIEDFKDRY